MSETDSVLGTTMSISEALRELDACNWLKVSARHVSASKYKTHAELWMLSAEDRRNRNSIYHADVTVRRKKSETFEELLVRAATMVRSGYVPKTRVPPKKFQERCACGSPDCDLAWNPQLNQRMCRKCSSAWAVAARHNDMAPVQGDDVQ